MASLLNIAVIQNTLKEVHHLRETAQHMLETADKISGNLERLMKEEAKSNSLPQATLFKRPDQKKLSDAGVAAVNAAFESGATVMQVAREFDITASAASHRRQIWLASKANLNSKVTEAADQE